MWRKLEARSKGQQSNVARLLDGQAEATLMPCAHSGQTARNDLATLGNEALQQANVAIGDGVDLLGAELADLLAPEELAAAWTATRSAGGTWGARTGARAGVTSMAAARAGCMCVLLSRLRAVGFVSHDISLSGTLCLPPLQTRIGVSEHSTSLHRVEAKCGDFDALCDANKPSSQISSEKLDRGGDSLGCRMLGWSCCSWLLLFVGLSGGGRFGSRCMLCRCDRLRAALHLGIAEGLDLCQALLFFVHAHGDELDHLLGHAQAALDLSDQRTRGGNIQQHVKAVIELAHG